MSKIFTEIGEIVAKLSTGPTAALVIEISSNVRYAIVQPYNFYFINNKKSIVLMLTSSRVPPNTNFNAIELFSTDNSRQKDEKKVRQNYIVSKTTINDINKYFTNKHYKFILFKDVKAYTIEEILNRMLELGIFTIE